MLMPAPADARKASQSFRVQLDIQRELGVPTLGGAAIGGLNAAHEMACLGDQEATVVEAANEHVQVLVGHFGRVI
jgi:hypothetical protein